MGSRLVRRIAIVVAVLLVLLIVADRVGNAIAERAAADTIQSAEHLSSRPDVDISGFPFLTQLASGHFGEVTVTAKDVPIGTDAVPLVVSRIRVVLHSLTLSHSFHSAHADSADANALLSYADLGDRLDAQLSYAGDGRVRASKSVTFGGISVDGTVTMRPVLAHGSLAFADVTVENAGRLSNVVAAALVRVFDLSLSLARLPFHVHVTRVEAVSQGIALGLTGADLSYSR